MVNGRNIRQKCKRTTTKGQARILAFNKDWLMVMDILYCIMCYNCNYKKLKRYRY